MLVKNWMSKTVITVDAGQSMQQAIHILKENNINLLPVLENGKLVGVVSDRDLKKASPSDATTLDFHEMLYLISRIKVKDLMTPDPFTTTERHTVEEAALLLLEHRISGLPVVDSENTVIGVITKSDLFRVLIAMTGLGKIGLQIAVQVEDRLGIVKEIKEIIHEFEGRTANVLTSDINAPEGSMNVYFRIHRIDREKLEPLKEKIKEKGTLMYVVDYRENRRDIFI